VIEMSLTTIAAAMGVPLHALDELLDGHSTEAIAARLRTGSELVQEFIDGRASGGVAAAIGAPPIFVQDLRERLGHDGAIGLLVGLCLAHRG
jgi:hypothetical protein